MDSKRRQRGFTLIELMVVLIIIGILLAMAIPSYRDYLLKSQVRAAQADLAALALNAENFLQRQLRYHGTAEATTPAVIAVFAGWSPAQVRDFQFAYTPTIAGGAAVSYSLSATWTGSSDRLAGCVLTQTSANTKTMSAGCNKIMGATTW